LGDEISELVWIEDHEPSTTLVRDCPDLYVYIWGREDKKNVLVHLVHARVSHISRESSHADFTATEKGTEKLIQMSK
jgi:hypothetical protein